ncbi:MAG: ABC transporter ATP-binding protein [Alphaproteobacteria bacterium]|nr:ABC transporter ATP-binding protein [Alphaproteobacteria bacterium]
MTAAAPLLAVEGLRCGYGSNEIIHGIDFAVRPGEVVTILGPNGCGKTTFLKAVLGYISMSHGAIRFSGTDITGLSPDARAALGIGYVPQLANVFKPLTIRENLEMGGYRLDGDALEAAIERLFALFPILRSRSRQRAGTLSGGERQVLAMARAMMVSPTLLFLDEPSAGLSPRRADEVFDHIRTITGLGTAAVIIEQDAKRALSVSARACVFVTGQIAFEGSSAAVLADERIRTAYLGGRPASGPANGG